MQREEGQGEKEEEEEEEEEEEVAVVEEETATQMPTPTPTPLGDCVRTRRPPFSSRACCHPRALQMSPCTGPPPTPTMRARHRPVIAPPIRPPTRPRRRPCRPSSSAGIASARG